MPVKRLAKDEGEFPYRVSLAEILVACAEIILAENAPRKGLRRVAVRHLKDYMQRQAKRCGASPDAIAIANISCKQELYAQGHTCQKIQ